GDLSPRRSGSTPAWTGPSPVPGGRAEPIPPGRLLSAGMAEAVKIVVLDGDQTGQELLDQAVRLLDPRLLGIELELLRFDLSLEQRRATGNQVVTDAAQAMREAGLGLKA